MSKEELTTKIENLKKEKADIKGTTCEVFSRIVGYLSPVQNWNKSKKEEFKLRKMYNLKTVAK